MNYSDYADQSVAQVMSLLKEKLSAEQWREADELTKIIMIKTSSNKKDNYLSLNLDDFPSDVLEEIDWLWQHSSNYHFGFSVQKNIFNSENYSDFISKVGWHTGDSWLSYSDLSFTENAPKGHLPYCGRHFWQSVSSGKTHFHHDHKPHFHPPHSHSHSDNNADGIGAVVLAAANVSPAVLAPVVYSNNPPQQSHSHSDNNADGAGAAIGAVIMAAVPWLIGAAVVGGAGYLIYREVTKEKRKQKQRLLEEENIVEQNIRSLLALI